MNRIIKMDAASMDYCVTASTSTVAASTSVSAAVITGIDRRRQSLTGLVSNVADLRDQFLRLFWPNPNPAIVNAQPSAAAENPPPPFVQPRDRVFTGVTPADLHEYFVGRTDVQAREQLHDYVRTWVEVSGSLRDMTGDTIWFSEFGYPATLYGVSMRFREEKWLQRLRVMKVGAKLKVIGEFVAADQRLICLDNCEVVGEAATPRQ
jgi:hypothetical protein